MRKIINSGQDIVQYGFGQLSYALDLAGTFALNTGTVILTYRVPSVTPESE